MPVRFLQVTCLAILTAMLVAGCATTYQPVVWENNSSLLVITINSVPTDAAVYGMQGSTAGEFIGRTSLTLKYSYNEGGFTTTRDPVVCWNCDYRQTLTIERAGGLFKTKKANVWFKCLVAKDGYEPYYVNELVYNVALGVNIADPLASSAPDIKYAFEGNRKDFTAILSSKAAPPSSQSQQQ